MNLKNEVKEEVYRYDLDLSTGEEAFLVQIGLDLICKDKKALINYAVIRILEDQLKTLSDKMDGEGLDAVQKAVVKCKSKNKKGNKNGTKN